MRKPQTILIFLAALLLCLSCGDSDKVYTVHDKLTKIAILEDSRDMGRGELLDYLSDPDPEIRACAVIALGRIEWPETAAQLGRLMADSVEAVRLETAFALGQLGDSNGIFPITARLRDEESVEVKCAMIEALGKLGNPVVVGILAEYASDPNPSVRGAVAFALSHMPGHSRTSDLIQLSRDSIADVRWKAVFAMSRTADSTALGRLRWCLKDSVSLVRQYAARAIGALRDSSGLKHLTDRLRREKDNLVKINLIRSIARVGDRKALKSLLNVLSGKHPDYVKAEAVTAMGRLGLEKAFAKLRPFLNDENRTLRGSAITAVAQTNPGFFLENIGAYLDGADQYIKSRILDGLPAIGTPQVFDVATELFSDDDPRVRRKALQSMLEFEKVNAPNLLHTALDDPDFTVVVTAVDAIALRKDSTFVEQLEDIYSRHLSDKEPDVRLTVIEGLSDWIDSTTTEQTMLDIFDRALDDSDYHVRKAAIGAFRKIGIDRSSALGVFDTDISPENFDAIFNRFISNPTAVIKTNRGDITFELLYDVAPKTVSNFVDLARSGFYDQKIWHRVIPSFVIQDGCPRGDGWGGPGYSIRCEYNRKRYTRGTVGMARSGKDTGGSQFFIAHTTLPHLDGQYTVFGQVVSGMRTVDRIEVGDSIRTIEIIADEKTD